MLGDFLNCSTTPIPPPPLGVVHYWDSPFHTKYIKSIYSLELYNLSWQKKQRKIRERIPKQMLLLFMGSKTSSQAQNLIFTVQSVATRVLNLSSKFQLDRTTDEAGSTCWWNMGRCVFFLFLLFSLFFFS